MGWGAYIQGGEDFEKIDRAGSQLSLVLNCAVHYPAYEKRLFECSCNIVFPAYAVEAAMVTNEWSLILERHGQK